MDENTRGDSALSDDQRRAVFRQELSLTSETGAGRIIGRVPKKFTRGLVAAMLVLGVGGELVDHYFANVGLPTSSPTTFTTPTTIPLVGTTTVPNAITASQAFIRLRFIGSARVPHFALTDQRGATITPTARGKVTLITFYNKNCNDICPVLGAELRATLADLGAKARNVEVDIVNTDPFSYGVSRRPLALTATGLGGSNVHFLTGSVSALDAVWTSFGIQVKVGATANEVAHNAALYFVDPTSQLTALATPFAHESATGVFSLNGALIQKFAQGIERETVSLMQ
ncbi:MAG: SCO family protein [Acidobacteria bacterium]|nr:SCO family protein [Acidobacteriota bacterium]